MPRIHFEISPWAPESECRESVKVKWGRRKNRQNEVWSVALFSEISLSTIKRLVCFNLMQSSAFRRVRTQHEPTLTAAIALSETLGSILSIGS